MQGSLKLAPEELMQLKQLLNKAIIRMEVKLFRHTKVCRNFFFDLLLFSLFLNRETP